VVIGLMAVGALTQVAATLPLLWAMAVVGLAIPVTVSLGASLVTCAILGRIMLGEPISGQALVAIGLLIGAVGFLTFGAEAGAAAVPAVQELDRLSLFLVAAVPFMAGAIYGLLSVTIRRSVTGGVPVGFVAMVIPAMGVICLAPGCFWRLGPSAILATPTRDVLVMLLAGLLNVVAWFAFIKGLQTTRVVHANVLTAAQVAMAAVAGIFLFEEAASPALLAGVAMTIAGMVSIDRPVSG
jgi:drug/metabolite transporter (DMT)-like permease